jgi:hypothetical protein
MKLRKPGKAGVGAMGILCGALVAASGGVDADPVPARPRERDGCRQGYRLQNIRTDYALGNSWAILANCIHPEMPRLAVAIDVHGVERHAEANLPRDWQSFAAQGEFAAQGGLARVALKGGTTLVKPSDARAVLPPPAVQAGGNVRLRRDDQSAHVDLAGIALESGRTGDSIRVRVMPGGIPLRGIVRAPGWVELQAAGVQGFRKERH